MTKTLTIALLLGASLWTMAAEKGAWPQWRGTTMNSIAQDADFQFEEGMALASVWKHELGSGYSSLAIADQKVFAMASKGTDDVMVALDAKTGKELWQYRIDATYKGHSGSHDGTLSSPVVEGGMIYGLGPNGQLFCLKTDSGKEVWKISLKDMHSVEPTYGWSTSPLIYKNLLLCQIGVKEKTYAAFDKANGKQIWAMGDDVITYQSPILAEVHGETHFVVTGAQKAHGLHPESGKILWTFEHKGGGEDGTPLVIGPNKFFLEHAHRESIAFEILKTANGFEAKELWKTIALKNTNNPSIYHNGFLYGYSGPTLSCVDAATGERVWRSRKPGDGFISGVNDYLVVITKKGTLHLAKFNSKSYEQLAELKIFDSLGWNPPSIAYGNIFVRNLKEIACVTLQKAEGKAQPTAKKEPARGISKGTAFAEFVQNVQATKDKQTLIDEFMKAQKSFPIVEANGWAHFVFQEKVEDIGIAGDMFYAGENLPMNHVDGTDFYYFSVKVKPDAQMSYVFIKDYETRITDPLNPNIVPSFQGDMSELRMPKWKDSQHLSAKATNKGKIEKFEFESKALQNKRDIRVYLPSGYDQSEARYPVLYIHYGAMTVEMAQLPTSMDNLAGKTVNPAILVFIHLNPENSYQEVSGDKKEGYAEMIAKELVPAIDAKYRTLTDANSRSFLGHSSGGFISIYTALKYPGVFGKVAGQSTNVANALGEELKALIESKDKVPTSFYLDWGSYDIRTEDGNVNRKKVNEELWKWLKAKGYNVSGGETPHGYGWGSWRTLNDTLLEWFFPLGKTAS